MSRLYQILRILIGQTKQTKYDTIYSDENETKRKETKGISFSSRISYMRALICTGELRICQRILFATPNGHHDPNGHPNPIAQKLRVLLLHLGLHGTRLLGVSWSSSA